MEKEIERKVKKYFGEERELKDIERLLGGAQKHVYLVTLDNGFKFVVYVWDKSTNYFSDSERIDSNEFLSSSPLMFKLNNELMKKHGVNTPKLYYIDSSFEQPTYAFVEYIDGVDLDYIIENQPERLNDSLHSLKESIDKLHEIKAKEVGQVNNLLGENFNQIKYCYDGAVQSIKYLIKVDSENSNIYVPLNEILEKLIKKIDERSEFKLIHSELGPNHVMVDKDNNAYIIDIEGARFFDLEYEESFLKIRFNNNYKYLKSDNLDETRMDFYHICHCVGNLAGAYELLYKNYYDTEDILGMINYFTKAIKAMYCWE